MWIVNITFVQSAALVSCYHAMTEANGATVGLIQQLHDDKGWRAVAYRNSHEEDLQATFIHREAAEQFVRANAMGVTS